MLLVQSAYSFRHPFENSIKEFSEPRPPKPSSKLDLTKYNNYKEVSDSYTMKHNTFIRRKEFEPHFLENYKDYRVDVIYNDIDHYSCGSSKKYIKLYGSNKRTISVEYYHKHGTNTLIITHIYYGNILYKKLVYKYEDCFTFDKIVNGYNSLSQYRIGRLYTGYISNCNILNVYNGQYDTIHRLHKNKLKRGNMNSLHDLRKRTGVDLIMNDYKYVYKYSEYNPYADIKEIYNFIVPSDDARKIIESGNTIITNYGMSYSKTVINIYGRDEKQAVTKFTNTESQENPVEMTLKNNSVLELKIDNRVIDLDDIIGYKIASVTYNNEEHCCLLHLKIPKHACIATSDNMKYRCDKMIPTNVFIMIDGELKEIEANTCKSSIHNSDFTYYINKLCIEPNFNGDLSEVCLPGLHYYLSRDKAIREYGSDAMKEYFK